MLKKERRREGKYREHAINVEERKKEGGKEKIGSNKEEERKSKKG